MLGKVNAAVAPLRAALDTAQWKVLRGVLQAIPTDCSTPIGSEMVRVAVDVMIEECSFNTAYERSFVVRRALHAADVSKWLVRALKSSRPGSTAIRRLVMLAEMLATSEEGRTRIGRARGVGAIVRAWCAHPNFVEAPAALSALCAGHIDNISRLMRSGGIAVACTAIDVALQDDIPKLLNQSLLLLGLCTICTPDRRTGAKSLVPFVRSVIVSMTAATKRTPLAHAVNIIGNIAECWRKEGRGFDIADPHGITGDIVNAWAGSARNRDIVNASAWALNGLLQARKVKTSPPQLYSLVSRSGSRVAAVRALRDTLEEMEDVFDDSASEITHSCLLSELSSFDDMDVPSSPLRGVKRAANWSSSEESVAPSTPKRARKMDDSEDPGMRGSPVSVRHVAV